MSHPVIEKYRRAGIASLSPEARVAARKELKRAINGRGANRTPTEKERIVLIRLLMQTFEEPAAREGAPAADAAAPAPRRRRIPRPRPKFTLLRAILAGLSILRVADVAFLLVVIGICGGVVLLGARAVDETLRLEQVKREAEAIAAWLKTKSEARGEAGFAPAACGKEAGGGWSACLAALDAEGGPAAGRVNLLDRGHAFFAAKCDKQDVGTLGAVVVERGAPSSSGGVTYTAFEGTESLAKDLVLRVIVCGRGFHVIKVAAEIAF